jgi:Transposase.
LGPLLYPRAKTTVKQWKYAESMPPKKPKAVQSARKVMASVFWDADRLSSHRPKNYGANIGKDAQKKARFGKEKSHLIRTTPTCTQVLLPWKKFVN